MDINGDFVAAYSDLIETPIEAEALAELNLMRADPELWVDMHAEMRKILGKIRASPDGLDGINRRADAALRELWRDNGSGFQRLLDQLPEMPVVTKLAYWNVYSTVARFQGRPVPPEP